MAAGIKEPTRGDAVPGKREIGALHTVPQPRPDGLCFRLEEFLDMPPGRGWTPPPPIGIDSASGVGFMVDLCEPIFKEHPMRCNYMFGAGFACLALAGAAFGQDVNPLQAALKDTDVKGAWIYNDLSAGIGEARKSGKPMLVVFR